MRILVLIHEYPPVGGGGGRVAQDLCCGLAQRGHDVRVLTAHWGELPLQETQQSVQLTRLRTGRKQAFKATLPDMLAFDWAALWAGRRLIRDWNPDILHVHFAVPAGLVALQLARWSGVPYVLTAHLGDVPGGVPEKTSKWFRWIYPFTPPIWKNAAQVVAVSEFTRDLARQHYPGVPVQVIPNGADLNLLNPGEIALQSPPRIVFAGRFMPQKDPLRVLHTLAQLRDLPWTCSMLGDGPLYAEAQRQVAELGLQDRIELPGWVQPNQVIEVFRRSDILFMPSLSEGMPVVGVQALAMGLALAVTDVGGWRGLVQPGINGSLFDPQQPQQAQEELRRWLTQPDRLLAARRASRAHAANYDLAHILDQYEALFTALRQERSL